MFSILLEPSGRWCSCLQGFLSGRASICGGEQRGYIGITPVGNLKPGRCDIDIWRCVGGFLLQCIASHDLILEVIDSKTNGSAICSVVKVQ